VEGCGWRDGWQPLSKDPALRILCLPLPRMGGFVCHPSPFPPTPLPSQSYAGRLAAASPAAGSSKIHDAEQAKVIADAFA
jgi:hypothetical protein